MTDKKQNLLNIRKLTQMYELEIRGIDRSTNDGELKFRLNRMLLTFVESYAEELPDLGDEFMRTFRKTDVIEAPGVDSAIWQLLDLPQTDLFWYCMNAVLTGSDKPKRPYTAVCSYDQHEDIPLLYLVNLDEDQVEDEELVRKAVAEERHQHTFEGVEYILTNLTVHMLFRGDLTPVRDYR